MSTELKKSDSNARENSLTLEEQQKKINEVRKFIGTLPEKLAFYCSDACISRYLRARNWHVKKATKMLKATLKWRAEYKPEEIRWEEVSREAETGKIYRSNYKDKHGRTVLVMRPRCQNSKSTRSQIMYLVYCMENAILNLPADQEQMVWLIDFHDFNMSNISVKVTRETAHVLQEHYPERLGVAILYDSPKFFEPFWKMVKPFLEPKTANKVKFVYSEDPNTTKIMEELFSMDQLESAFGGKDAGGFDISKYAERMKEDDKKMSTFWAKRGNNATTAPVSASTTAPVSASTTAPAFNHEISDSDSDASQEKSDKCSSHELYEVDEEAVLAEANLLMEKSCEKRTLVEN